MILQDQLEIGIIIEDVAGVIDLIEAVVKHPAI